MYSARITLAASLIVNLLAPFVLNTPAHAITCNSTVTNTNNSGAGSLANALSSGGGICFNIAGGGVHTISPTTSLTVGVAATIDGTTQPGYAGAPLIEINGANAGASSGIVINAGNTTVKGLIVNRFGGDGIIISNNNGNTIQANYVGTNSAGTAALGNGHSGIGVASSNNTIGGTTATTRNIVSGNVGTGIAISGSGATGNVVEGNYVGTDPTGTVAIGNGADGLLITQSPGNTVGGTTGTTPGGGCNGACNLLSGNGANGAGIWQSTASGNTIAGNYIGTTVSGLSPLSNQDIGVEAQDAPNNTIGGTTATARNLISGNLGAGVSLTGTSATGNNVYGNYIGTDTSGNGSIGNHKMGVNLGSPSGGSNNASSNNIGGTTGTTPGGACTGACNVIVSNAWSGIYISGSTGGGNGIAGNFIGVGANGITPLGNTQDGIGIVGSSSNTIGTSNANARNLISANGGNGIAIVGSTSGYNHIEGNYIGEGTDGSTMGNAISGVAVGDGIQTAIVTNSIANNAFMGIDVNLGGVNSNHSGGPTGVNGMENYPILNYAIPLGSNEQIAGTLNSVPNTSFRIEFFQSPACMPVGYGQGRSYLGSVNVATDGAGNASFTQSVPLTIGGMSITATSTRIIGGIPAETSEFSHCIFTPRQHPDGTLIRPAGSSNIFLVEGGATRPIGSSEVLASYHMSAAEFKTATNADTNDPGGAGLYFREGTLIKGSGPNVYVIDQTGPASWVKRLITSINFFTGLGYTVADIINVPDSALGAPNGPDIGGTTQHPDGTLVKDPGGPTVYLIENSQKRLVGSMPMFTSQRYNLSSTKSATSSDLGLANGPNLNFREGAVIKGSSPNVYVVDDTGSGFTKRRIGSAAALNELGYTSADIINIIDAELPPADGPEI